jgi:hypothetical protein
MGTGTPDRYPKALDSNSRVEENGGAGESEVRNSEERRVLRAQAERRYRPKAATAPEKAQVITPGMIPAEARF